MEQIAFSSPDASAFLSQAARQYQEKVLAVQTPLIEAAMKVEAADLAVVGFRKYAHKLKMDSEGMTHTMVLLQVARHQPCRPIVLLILEQPAVTAMPGEAIQVTTSIRSVLGEAGWEELQRQRRQNKILA
jgi:hypothetical protein